MTKAAKYSFPSRGKVGMGARTMTIPAPRLPLPSPGRAGSKTTGQFVQKILPFLVFGLALLLALVGGVALAMLFALHK